MYPRKITAKIIIISIILTVLLALLVFANLRFVQENPGGLDLLAHWQGTRSFLKNGIDPYSDQAANAITTSINAIGVENPGTYRFVSPLTSFIVLVPLSLIRDFTVARIVWMTLLEVLLLGSSWLISKWIRTGRSIRNFFVVVITLLLFYPAVSALLIGSLDIVSFAFSIAAIFMLAKHQDEAAGVLLSLSLINPDMVYPLIVGILFWALINHRIKVVWWLLGSTILLIGFTMVLIPNWPISYLQSIIENSANNPVRETELAPTALAIRLMLVKNLSLLVLLIYEIVVVKNRGDYRLLWIMGLLLITDPWFGVFVRTQHLIFVVPALFIGIGFILDFWKGRSRNLVFLAPLLIVSLSWIFSGQLLPGFSPSWNKLITTTVLPLVTLLIIFWSRWWVIRQEKFSMESITKLS